MSRESVAPRPAAIIAPRTREPIAVKARRYLTEGRITILQAGPGHVIARARGAGAVYDVRYRRGAWSCSCPAIRSCCHIEGLKLVTAPEGMP